MSINPKTGRPPRSFAEIVADQRNGELAVELADKLAELTAAVRAQGKAGSITLTIGIKPMPKVDGAFTVSDDVKVKTPQRPRGESIFYAEADGSLTRSDPRQAELPGMKRRQMEQAAAKVQADLRDSGQDVTVTVASSDDGVGIEPTLSVHRDAKTA